MDVSLTAPPHQFELHMALPADERLVPMVRALALHGAKVAGVDDRAAGFCAAVESAVREALSRTPGASIPVVVRCAGGPVEVAIGQGADARTVRLDV